MLKRPELPSGFQGRVFKCNIWGKGCSLLTFFWLAGGKLTGWCFGNLNHQPSCSNQSGVYMLVVSTESPSFTWVGVLVSAEQLKDMHQIVMYIPWGGTRTLFYCWTIAFPLLLHSLTSLISNCLSLLFGTQGRPRRLKPFSTNKKWRGFCTQEGPTGCCLVSIPHFLWYSSTLRWTGVRQERE